MRVAIARGNLTRIGPHRSLTRDRSVVDVARAAPAHPLDHHRAARGPPRRSLHVIATARVDVTRSVLVRVEVEGPKAR